MSSPSTLRLRFEDRGDLVFAEKIPGLNTHAPDVGHQGFVEILQAEVGTKLYVVHRLDKETSGAMVFAKSPEAAKVIGDLFETHQVKKRYVLLANSRRFELEVKVSSLIEKKGSAFVSSQFAATPNARTTFRWLKRGQLGELWEAEPETGKPHQIRLHAADLSMPILGDVAHGGAAFPRLCLHSKSLLFSWKGAEVKFEASNPAWMNDWPADQAILLDTIQSRAALFDLSHAQNECLRLVHLESDLCRIDQYGPQLWVSWYAVKDPTPEQNAFLASLSRLLKKPLWLRLMKNRGSDPRASAPVAVGSPLPRWEALENNVRFELRSDSGNSAGLFLDQRENRRWVRDHAKGLRVLNLFAYTAGFSVNAALGGAKEVCTVDVSKNMTEWAKRNFELNKLDASKYEFWVQDCFLFLAGARKRLRKWDLIICDPPSFGRSKEGTFQIHKHLPELLEAALGCIDVGGKILLSTNYEGWTLADLQKQVFVYRSIYSVDIENVPRSGLDYERPDEDALMKSLVIRRTD